MLLTLSYSTHTVHDIAPEHTPHVKCGVCSGAESSRIILTFIHRRLANRLLTVIRSSSGDLHRCGFVSGSAPGPSITWRASDVLLVMYRVCDTALIMDASNELDFKGIVL